MRNPEQRGLRAPEDAERLAWAVVRAADRAVAEHERTCPARRDEHGRPRPPAGWGTAAVRGPLGTGCRPSPADVEMPSPIQPRVLAEIVAWLGAQWVDTHVWDVEAAAARFDVPTQVLWPELARYFRTRANGGWGR